MHAIVKLLKEKVLPWSETIEHRLILAQPQMNRRSLPQGVGLSRKKLKGKRVVVRGRRDYSNRNPIAAVWPEDNLIEQRIGNHLICVTSGEADLKIGENILHCPSGCFVLLPPGVPYPDSRRPHLEGKRYGDESQHCDLLWFMQRQSGIECWVCHSTGSRHWGTPDYSEQAFIHSATAVEMLNLMVDIAGRENISSKSCSGLLLSFITLLLHEIEIGNVFSRANLRLMETSHSEVRSWDPIQEAKMYIRRHLREKLTAQRVASAVHLSRTQFMQRFRAEAGQTFNEFVTACRLEEAKLMLSETDYSVAFISRTIGLTAASYFSEMFQKHTGFSPLEFRHRERHNR